MHRGIYINEFNKIIEYDSAISTVLHWSFIQKFNAIYLYNIGKILKNDKHELLDAFIKKARKKYPHLNITFVSASHKTSFNRIVKYLENYENPDGIVSEIEFWNDDKSFENDYLPWLKRVENLKSTLHLRGIDFKTRCYIGGIKNGGEMPNIQIARDLVKYHDEIFLANYHKNAFHFSSSTGTNSIGNRLRLLAQAGAELSQKVNISILFNVYQNSPAPHIWDYFAQEKENHDFKDAFYQFKLDFAVADNIPYKNMLNLIGYSIYRYSDAYEARN